jgi:hypothetical protein
MSSIFDQLTAPESEAKDLKQEATLDTAFVNNEENETVTSAESVHYTPEAIKETSQELLRFGLIESSAKPNVYQTAITHHKALNDIFEPLDLRLTIDDVRGLAFLLLAESVSDSNRDEWTHPLIRKQRLTLEQSLLLAILREFYLAHESENGIGSSNAMVPLSELLPRVRIYLGELGSDVAEEKRLRNILEKLKIHGVVSDVDEYGQIKIRPIITHLANPENLTSLLQALRQQKESSE